MSVAAKRVLQKAGEFRVAVRNVGDGFGAVRVAERRNNIAEGEETAVDGDALLRAIASSSRALEL